MDRNTVGVGALDSSMKSLSARRAWIEMVAFINTASNNIVALRKESVDRNPVVYGCLPVCWWSLSARRAWIEIFDVERLPDPSTRRSPQGERG